MRQLALALCAVLPLASIAPPTAQAGTRGVGAYPGDPREDFAPTLVPEATTYRNLALRRATYQSSSYDYNLTGQLVTDGIKAATLPRWLVTTTSAGGVAPKHERELLVDRNPVSGVDLDGPQAWVQIELAGGEAPLEVDRIDVEMRPRRRLPFGPGPERSRPEPMIGGAWTLTVTGSDDGRTWRRVGLAMGTLSAAPALPKPGDWPGVFRWYSRANPVAHPSVASARPLKFRFYRIALETKGEKRFTLSEVAFFRKDARIEVGGPYHFTSAWKPAGTGEEWVSVDLGGPATFDRVALHWIQRPIEGAIQVSEDEVNWRDVAALPAGPGLEDDLSLGQPAQARYVRVLVKRAGSPGGCVLSELEVYGRGGLVPEPHAAATARDDGRLDLSGGAWRLQRDSLVTADGRALSTPGFADADWVIATVPATVLSSYWNAGALPDPNYGDNQLAISDSFFYADFWYRTEFVAPAAGAGRRLWLNFDGINWKAEVYLNGEKLGRVEGAFTRGRFDVTDRARPGQRNALAVRVEKNATPGSMKQKTLESAGLNGGALGADNPTYHASIGWDWIPTVRGRNIGIWNDVFLCASGPLTIADPLVRTTLPLPDTSRADVRIEATLENHEARAVRGVLRARFGDFAFEQAVALAPGAAQTIALDPATHPALRLANPRLWWPAGYGEPALYPVELSLLVDGQVSDRRAFQSGVRQFTYSEDGGVLKIWINGRRFVGRGGNWGFPETNLRYRGREYDAAVRYHRDMNFTMIRNWVGQTGDDELYEACDRHGIVVWQDFWLANPFDGPDPTDNDLFLRNVRDTALRIRNHPSVGLYCGRNEGDPPLPLDRGMRAALAELTPDVHYISNSASGVVSGGGPYAVQTPKYYFEQRATARLHSELGMPSIPTIESVRQMMPDSALWPQALDWGLHDFNLGSAQSLSRFQAVVKDSYGGADNVSDWVSLAQFVNYDGYRAMFEAQSKNRMGVLLWMSHPAWPSFVWQTYDYYLEPNAAYFGSKKGSEPLHIQWNAATDEIEVVNYSAGQASGLSARAELLNMDGAVVWQRSATLESAEDSAATAFKMEYPEGLTPVHFIRLKLLRDGQIVSENFYWRGAPEGRLEALRTLPKVTVEATTRAERAGDTWVLATELHNSSRHPALLVRLSAVRGRSGDRILPILLSDNYVALMPGERRTIRTELQDRDARGETPRIVVDGFNVQGAGQR